MKAEVRLFSRHGTSARVGTVRCVVIDHDSHVPVWRQLAEIIRADIASGRIESRVPSVRTLAEQYELSTNTVQKAINALKREGLIVGTQGKGTYVRPQ
jgi:DNA-binding GntR family transcriptional regulator